MKKEKKTEAKTKINNLFSKNDRKTDQINHDTNHMTKTQYKIVGIFGIILIIIGLCIFFYPIISNLLSEFNHSTVIRNYNNDLDSLDEETISEAYEDAVTYNENLSGDPVHDPFLRGSRICYT